MWRHLCELGGLGVESEMRVMIENSKVRHLWRR